MDSKVQWQVLEDTLRSQQGALRHGAAMQAHILTSVVIVIAADRLWLLVKIACLPPTSWNNLGSLSFYRGGN